MAAKQMRTRLWGHALVCAQGDKRMTPCGARSSSSSWPKTWAASRTSRATRQRRQHSGRAAPQIRPERRSLIRLSVGIGDAETCWPTSTGRRLAARYP
jgi:hypothetical protein